MRGWPLVFWLVTAFNAVIGAALLLAPATVYGWANWTAPPNFEPRLIGWFVLVFAAGYGLVARNPLANRGIIQMCAIGKAGAAGVVWSYWLAGKAPGLFALGVAGDMAWMVVFAIFLWRTRDVRR